MQMLDVPPAVPVRAIEDVIDERMRQICHFGHTPADDARLPLGMLPREAAGYLQDAIDEILRSKPGWQARARKKLVKGGALTLAALDRLDNAASGCPSQPEALGHNR